MMLMRVSMKVSDKESISKHIPVLGQEVLGVFKGEYRARLPRLNKYKIKFEETLFIPKTYFDGTFGRGGHLRLVQQEFPGIHITALDKDSEAVEYGKKNFSQQITQGVLQILQADFSDFYNLIDQKKIPLEYDLMLLDLGVSSPQLDKNQRGFSFYQDGPLDMRMNQNQKLTAVDVINNYSEENLWQIFRDLGEIRSPERVVRKIIEMREQKILSTTMELSKLIEKVDGWKKKGHHPATLYFMALRMEVNGELDAIRQTVPLLIKHLSEGGRLVVISFHSLEDRLVKSLFQQNQDKGCLLNRKAVVASEEEVNENPRSRSARLRAFQKGIPKKRSVDG